MTRRADDQSGEPDVEPLDVDGVRTVALVTVLWGVAFVVLAVRRSDLEASGNEWWLWTCLAGVGLGLLGVEYARKRRDAVERARLLAEAEAETDESDETTDADDVEDATDPGAVESERVTRPIETAGPSPLPRRSGTQSPQPAEQQPPVAGQLPRTRGDAAATAGPVSEPTAARPPIKPAVPPRATQRRQPRRAMPDVTTQPPLSKPAEPKLPSVTDSSPELGQAYYEPKRARPTSPPPNPKPAEPKLLDSTQQAASEGADEPLLDTEELGRRSRSRKKAQDDSARGSDEQQYRGRRRRVGGQGVEDDADSA